MARFYHEKETGYWINIDSITCMCYMERNRETKIFMADCPDPSLFNGNIIPDILNYNNDLTMHDKLFVNAIDNRFKQQLSLILTKIDNILSKVSDIPRLIKSRG